MITVSPAIDVVTDGLPREGTVAHRRWHTVNGKGDITANEQRPACITLPDLNPDDPDSGPALAAFRAAWRSFSGPFAVERGATPCTETACFGGTA
jgi:hypothetical protein